ncbi:MAG: hypothetical protein MK208_06265 [Shimia sp.]|uniref:YiiX/YebB-like N1pC/P60 family cysteine hydrolase n=1 Tax=Shimia sp. TaxID=1954381 RepID=UPI0026015491|nr:YiiX/YebB-like N1pC/P60 family cysteine hydrolase [Shimia sp.]MCH2066815.1 hypothetical protein [Shimia sp.]
MSSVVAHGDFIFSVLGRDENAISAVEAGYRGARFDHVGIAVEQDGALLVLEAIDPEVKAGPYANYVERSKNTEGLPRLAYARLLPEYRHWLPAAVRYGMSQLGVSYDKLFLPSERQLYCSELIVDMFAHANGGPFFRETPMSFRRDDTGNILDDWSRRYAHYGVPVPEGAPGSHPGGLSLDHRLHVYRVEPAVPGYQR